MGKQLYFWQGEPIKTEFGYSVVTENEEQPLFWHNFECRWDMDLQKPRYGDAVIPAIRITTKNNYSFVIANHFGIGAHKLKNGGWPNYAHFSLDDKTFKEALGKTEAILFGIRNFDLENYEKHEALRREWQHKNFPEESKKMEALRAMIQRK